MKVEGSHQFKASPEQVWGVLLDPAVLKACIPGCQSLEPTGENEWKATMRVGVAAVRGTYTGTVRLSDQNPPHSYRLSVEGTGSAGFVRGSGVLTLVPNGEGTNVNVEGDAQVGGTVANVGQRLIGGAVKMMMGQFFGCVEKHIQPG